MRPALLTSRRAFFKPGIILAFAVFNPAVVGAALEPRPLWTVCYIDPSKTRIRGGTTLVTVTVYEAFTATPVGDLGIVRLYLTTSGHRGPHAAEARLDARGTCFFDISVDRKKEHMLIAEYLGSEGYVPSVGQPYSLHAKLRWIWQK